LLLGKRERRLCSGIWDASLAMSHFVVEDLGGFLQVGK
jgi:hypothetical protein